MMNFARPAAFVAGLLFAPMAFSGGDSPFPLTGEEENVQLTEVWETADGSKKVKLYKSENGGTYLIIETDAPKKVEVLRRTR